MRKVMIFFVLAILIMPVSAEIIIVKPSVAGPLNQSYVDDTFIRKDQEENLNVNSSLSLNSSIGYSRDINDTQFDLVDYILTLSESWLDTLMTALGYLKSYTETDPIWTANWTTFQPLIWNETYYRTDNATYDTLIWNFTYYRTDNATYDAYSTNVSYGDIFVNESGDTMTGDLNMSDNDIVNIEATDVNRTCYTSDCSAVIYHNGSGILIVS